MFFAPHVLSSFQVLQNLGKEKFSPQSFEQVGTRIAKVLEKVRSEKTSDRTGQRWGPNMRDSGQILKDPGNQNRLK